MNSQNPSTNHKETDLESLIDDVLDWQYMHGSLLKIPPDSGQILARPIGTTLFPSPFPRDLFEMAKDLQVVYNKLYMAVARDEEWLSHCLRDLIDSDSSLVGKLWRIHEEVKRDGWAQPVSFAILRSDYMLHVPRDDNGEPLPPQLKQVELNTFSVAGGVHSARISEMHRYLNRIGSYAPFLPPIPQTSLPANETTTSVANALLTAHNTYIAHNSPSSSNPTPTAILIPVQPNNVNICDERPLEEYLQTHHNIPTFRIEFGPDILTRTSLSPTGSLLYHHHHPSSSSPSSTPPNPTQHEISTIYYRAGYSPSEYHPSSPAGTLARLRLESSTAIKCPSILTQLASSKKIQQQLSLPGALERFLPPQEAARIRETFMPMYPLSSSPTSPLGLKARELATNSHTAENFILKPSLEGRGHNVHGKAIPAFLSGGVPREEEEEWGGCILMGKIEPPGEVRNSLVGVGGMYEGVVVSELGVFGTWLGEEEEEEEGGGEGGSEVKEGDGGEREAVGQSAGGGGNLKWIKNETAGFSFKTKPLDVKEMNVVKGWGCFDSPRLY
ncbi:MAG: hypothetical protein Q9219_005094 [cf. Caloplaca sp. 3 TL-2023]